MVNEKRIVYGYLFSETFTGAICNTKTVSLQYGSKRKWILIDFESCTDMNVSKLMLQNKKQYAIADKETGYIFFYGISPELVISSAKAMLNDVCMGDILVVVEVYKPRIDDFNNNDILGKKLIREINIINPTKPEAEQTNLF